MPLELRFSKAEPDFRRVVDDCEDDAARDSCLFPGRVGSYNISTVAERNNGDLIFYLGGFSPSDSGFYYSGSGRSPDAGADLEAPEFHRLSDNWFAFVSSF